MSEKYQYILFDLDGTLTDSGPGIMNGFEYAIEKMGREPVDRSEMRKFVGPPLKVSFGDLLGYSKEDTDRAIVLYRDYYNNMGGVLENSVYPGIVELLSDLKSEGKKLIVATSKNEVGTKTVLEHFELKKFFDFVATADDKIRPRKTDVIKYALDSCGITDLSQVVMVGDRENDILAANEIGIDSIGVLYGYGDSEELTAAGATYLAEKPSDVKKLIIDDISIRLETEKDYRAVEELTRNAFWNVYKPGADEHYYVHTMRNHPDFIPELAFVLEKDGEIIGNIMYTKAWIEDENGMKKEIVSFGPFCVAPEYQRLKLGKVLIEHSFEAARKMGYDVNIIFGNPGNYVTRGFVSCKKKNISCFQKGNFPTALLVCEMIPGALDGHEWMYIPSTAADCCDDEAAVEEFDKTFPPKEKKWMPSQEEFYIYRNSSVVR